MARRVRRPLREYLLVLRRPRQFQSAALSTHLLEVTPDTWTRRHVKTCQCHTHLIHVTVEQLIKQLPSRSMRPSQIRILTTQNSSLQDLSPDVVKSTHANMAEPIDLTGLSDDGDDEDLRLAIALSLQEQEETKCEVPSPESMPEPTPEPQPQSAFRALGLNRKAMEEERLKRLATKRPRPTSEDDNHVTEIPPSKKIAVQSSFDSLPSKASSSAPASVPSATSFGFVQSRSNLLNLGGPLQFLNGTVKRTWAYGYPRTGDDIKIEEILQKDSLDLAVLSSYQWDDMWMLSKIDCKRTKVLLVAYAKDDAQVAIPLQNIQFCGN